MGYNVGIFAGLFLLSFLIFVVKVVVGLGNHGTGGFRDEVDRSRRGLPPDRVWFKSGRLSDGGDTTQDNERDVVNCLGCGISRHRGTCWKCGRTDGQDTGAGPSRNMHWPTTAVMSPPATPKQASGVDDTVQRILALKKLLDAGAITAEEYEARKRELVQLL